MIDNEILGTKEYLPDDHVYFTFLKKVFRHEFRTNGFRRITTPILENIDIQKIAYSDEFVGANILKIDDNIGLRYEPSLGILKSFLLGKFEGEVLPVHLYSIDRFFSKDLLNGGYLEKYFISGNIIGEYDPILDAILIYIVYSILNKIGLKETFKISINAIPSKKESEKYLDELKNFYENKKHLLSEEGLRHLQNNPLMLLNSSNEDEQILALETPIIRNFLKKDSKIHYEKFMEYLDMLNIPYEINNTLIPEFSYYTNTVWNIRNTETKNIISNGGRYNSLSKTIGFDKEVPAVGFNINVDCLINMLKEKEIQIKNKDSLDLCFVQLGDEAKKLVFKMSLEAREKGIKTKVSLGTPSMKEQILKAQRAGAKFVVMVGIMEARNGKFQVRDMTLGTQEEVLQINLIDYIIGKIGEENLDFYCPARDLTFNNN